MFEFVFHNESERKVALYFLGLTRHQRLLVLTCARMNIFLGLTRHQRLLVLGSKTVIGSCNLWPDAEHLHLSFQDLRLFQSRIQCSRLCVRRNRATRHLFFWRLPSHLVPQRRCCISLPDAGACDSFVDDMYGPKVVHVFPLCGDGIPQVCDCCT